MPNYFEILGVSFQSDQKEIKLAYVKKVREFPPEKEPEKYNEIRKAYETLMDERKKKQYVAYINFGQEIDELDKSGNEAMDKGDYEKAIGQFKKILLIEPSIAFAQNKLALSFIYNNQYDEGIKILERLVEKYPKDGAFVGNLAYSLKTKGELDKAEEYCLKALHLEPYYESNLSMLMDIYIEKKDLDKALLYLKGGIEKLKTEDLREFIYYYEFVRVSTNKNTSDSLREGMKMIENIVPHDGKIRSFILWKLSTFADDLYGRCNFTDASIILEMMIKLDSSNNYNRMLLDETKKLSKLVKLLDKFMEDDRLGKELKNIIYLYFVRFRMLYKEYEEELEMLISEIKVYKKNKPKDYEREINILRNQYTELFNLKKWLFKRIGIETKSS